VIEQKDERFTLRQRDILAIEIAWAQLPYPCPPTILHRCSWLNRAPLSEILELIERLSQRGDVRDGERWIWKMLLRQHPLPARPIRHAPTAA